MFRGLVVLFLAAPMVTASSRMDLESQFAQAKIAQNLLRSDVKHWQTEKNTLEELLDSRDTISAKASEKFQGQLKHAKKQLSLAEAALEVQNLELAKMEMTAQSDLKQGAHLSDSPLWAPGHEVPALAAQQEVTLKPAEEKSALLEEESETQDSRSLLVKRENVDVDAEVGKKKKLITVTGVDCTVTLKSQLSKKADCTAETFGCEGQTMWVADGCRGTFECNGDHEKCESISYKPEECRCPELKELIENKNKNPFEAGVGQDMMKNWMNQTNQMKNWMEQSKKAQDMMKKQMSNLLQKSHQLSKQEKRLELQKSLEKFGPWTENDVDQLEDCQDKCDIGFQGTPGGVPQAFEGLSGKACEDKCIEVVGYYLKDGDRVSLGKSIADLIPLTKEEREKGAANNAHKPEHEQGVTFD